MRTLLLVALMLAPCLTAQAGYTSNRIGSFTYITDNNTGQTTTCSDVGQFTYCN